MHSYSYGSVCDAKGGSYLSIRVPLHEQSDKIALSPFEGREKATKAVFGLRQGFWVVLRGS